MFENFIYSFIDLAESPALTVFEEKPIAGNLKRNRSFNSALIEPDETIIQIVFSYD